MSTFELNGNKYWMLKCVFSSQPARQVGWIFIEKFTKPLSLKLTLDFHRVWIIQWMIHQSVFALLKTILACRSAPLSFK